ncbi:MAG: tRNA (N6-isopentenyl adenosine(37)-C2)-methylthiotransferase MiaB [Candidatus Poriferisodalaceae bacterium]|nr:MAG: tRNA (N6-isopentenyl adenosine(37)-C2)-methylthiotransferase MiaB [Acidimicrobiales bacterium MED-G01]
MNRRYVVRTYGCQMNEHDSERIAGLLEMEGLEQTESFDDADVIVLNTCCIRENADNKLYGQLGNLKKLKEERPDLQIAVGGCLAQKDRDGIQQRAPHVDVVFGTHNVGRATDLLGQARVSGPITEIVEESASFPSALPVKRDAHHAAWVTIQIGCDNSCAFCIVPSVRGKEISRPYSELIGEVEQLAIAGVTEVTLLGQNVNSYGRDLTLKLRGTEVSAESSELVGEAWVRGPHTARPLFSDLLCSVAEVSGIRRVRYTSPHPKDLRPETIDAMAQVPEVCEHLHLPLQSGSDKVLSAMHRGYTADRYIEKVDAARRQIPDLALSTDIIVGFPGETDVDFERTLEVAAEVRFDNAYTFVYSPRPGTEAAELVEHFVPAKTSAERMERLRRVIERTSLKGNESRIGHEEEVVVEGPSKRDSEMLTGRTRHNRLVHFPAQQKIRPGSYAQVRVTEARTFNLVGELLEVTAVAKHRTRIPVVSS